MFLQIIRDPKHKQHDDILAWFGDGFDPEYFSVEEVNNLLTCYMVGCQK